MTLNLNELIEQVLVQYPSETSPREVAWRVFCQIEDDDVSDALGLTLPEYVRSRIAQRRVWVDPVEPEAEKFAPDDLLSPDGQKVQKKLLKARGSSRVNAIRTEWQRHFADRLGLPNGRWVLFGEATAADLREAAGMLRTTATALVGKADYYETLAEHVGTGKVSDLTSDPTRA